MRPILVAAALAASLAWHPAQACSQAFVNFLIVQGVLPPGTTCGFQALPTSPAQDPGLSVVGSGTESGDPLNIAVPNQHRPVGTDQFDLPASMTLVAQRFNDVVVLGEQVADPRQPGATLPRGVLFRVGRLRDFVLRDNATQTLIFASRLILEPQPINTVTGLAAGIQNVFEINNIRRGGFTGYALHAAWSRGSSLDLRLYSVARSAVLFGDGTRTFDPDSVVMQSDINVAEAHPWSGWFFIRTDATQYVTRANALDIWQGAEEGQPRLLLEYEGFVPFTPAPEPARVPLPLGATLGLGLLGAWIARRRLRRPA